MSGPVFVTGHSRGASEAALYALSRVSRGIPVAGVILFGCANPGDAAIGGLLRQHVPVVNVRNRRALVTDVPVDLRLLDEEYVQVAPFTEVDVVATAADALPDWGPFNDHHSQLYARGCAGMPGIVPAAIAAVVRLYDTADGWDWLHPEDGRYWALQRQADGSRLLIARGTATAIDWLWNFDALQMTACGCRVSAGFWHAVGPILAELDAAVS